jgi:hypothetical protein
MSRLKHPIRAIREPFGTAGLIVALVALVAALGGTALAAAKLNSGQKKEVEKIAKKYAGKPGAAGANGAAGPQGPAGAAGKDGTNGTAGTNGAPGESVTNKTLAKGSATCPEGGAEFVMGTTKTHACSGTTGFTSTLPSGKTETGTWALTGVPAKGATAFNDASISFPIPLALPAEAEYVITPPTAGCPGSVNEPNAEPGHFCVYEQFNNMEQTGFFNLENISGSAESSKFGDLVAFQNPGEELGIAFGSWAVTAK